MVIATKQSFWIKKPFVQSIMDALGQLEQQGYVTKLKTQITPNTIPSGDKELLEFLYNKAINI